MNRHQRRQRTRVVLTESPGARKAGPSPVVEEVQHPYRVDLTINDGDDLVFVVTLDAPDPDEAATLAGRRLREIIQDGHFITHFRSVRLDDEPLFPAQGCGDSDVRVQAEQKANR